MKLTFLVALQQLYITLYIWWLYITEIVTDARLNFRKSINNRKHWDFLEYLQFCSLPQWTVGAAGYFSISLGIQSATLSLKFPFTFSIKFPMLCTLCCFFICQIRWEKRKTWFQTSLAADDDTWRDFRREKCLISFISFLFLQLTEQEELLKLFKPNWIPSEHFAWLCPSRRRKRVWCSQCQWRRWSGSNKSCRDPGFHSGTSWECNPWRKRDLALDLQAIKHASQLICLQMFYEMLTRKVRKVVDDVRSHDFLLQQIFLVHEKNDRWVGKPRITDNCPEQRQRFIHAILQD